MKSAKSLTSALHSFFPLSSLLFLIFCRFLSSFPSFVLPEHPILFTRSYINKSLSCSLLHWLSSLVHILLLRSFSTFFTSSSTLLLCALFIFLASLSLLCPFSAPFYFAHCFLGLISLLAEAYWYTTPRLSPHPSQGSGHLIYRACLLHLSLHFPPLALTDRSPLSLCVHIDHSAWERRMLGGRRAGGETQYTLRTVVAEQTDRWQRSCSGGEGRPRRAGMDGKASLCWGWRGQAECGPTLGGEGGTEALADSLSAECIYSS